MRRRFLLLVVIVTAVITGCGNPNNIRIVSYDVTKIDEIAITDGNVNTVLHLNVGVDNPTGYKIRLDNLVATIVRPGGGEFADITTNEHPVISPRSCDTIPLALAVKLHSPMALFLTGGLDFKAMKVNLTADVSCGNIKRKIVREDCTIDELLATGPEKPKNK